MGLGVGWMVVAQQMQEAVHDEMLEVMVGLDATLGRLAPERLGRQHDVAEEAPLGRAPPGGVW